MKMNPETEEHFNRCSDDILLLASVTGVSEKRIRDELRNLCDTLSKANEQIEEIIKPLLENPPEDIPRLKKQIKHCKNPLEEKALQKRLNAALKKAKGKR